VAASGLADSGDLGPELVFPHLVAVRFDIMAAVHRLGATANESSIEIPIA